MEQIITQAPENLTEEFIKSIYEKNNNDVVNTLSELWDMDTNIITKPTTKWDEIRETCDSFDNEMQKMFNKNRTNGLS